MELLVYPPPDMDELPGYTPQAISDILPIYHQDGDGHIRTYTLRQTSPATQTFSIRDSSSNEVAYDVKSNKTGGFMNRKAHVIIANRKEGGVVAEGRFDIHGTGTSIIYSQGETQRLELEDSLAQVLRTKVQGSDMWWQPHPGNKDVLELTSGSDETIARFVSTAPLLQRTGSWPDRVGSVSGTKSKKDQSEYDVGELQVVDMPEFDQSAYEMVLCSAVVVIERMKRRAANMTKAGAALKGPASWGV